MGPPQGGGQSPVADMGMQMIDAFMQDPNPDNQAALVAVAKAIQQVLSQGQGGGPEGAMGAPQGAPPPQMGGQPPPGMM